jgi:hypothetical protein
MIYILFAKSSVPVNANINRIVVMEVFVIFFVRIIGKKELNTSQTSGLRPVSIIDFAQRNHPSPAPPAPSRLDLILLSVESASKSLVLKIFSSSFIPASGHSL